MDLYDLFFFKSTRSNKISGGFIYHGGRTKHVGVSIKTSKVMFEAVNNCLIRRLKVGIAFDFASNNFTYFPSNTRL